MTKCIEQSDPRYFDTYCNNLYDRHTYAIVFSNGQSENYNSWEEVQVRWFQTPTQFLSHVEVLDITKGFKS
jgi:hypothetical protein